MAHLRDTNRIVVSGIAPDKWYLDTVYRPVVIKISATYYVPVRRLVFEFVLYK